MSHPTLPTKALARDEGERRAIVSRVPNDDWALSLAMLGLALWIALGAVVRP